MWSELFSFASWGWLSDMELPQGEYDIWQHNDEHKNGSLGSLVASMQLELALAGQTGLHIKDIPFMKDSLHPVLPTFPQLSFLPCFPTSLSFSCHPHYISPSFLSHHPFFFFSFFLSSSPFPTSLPPCSFLTPFLPPPVVSSLNLSLFLSRSPWLSPPLLFSFLYSLYSLVRHILPSSIILMLLIPLCLHPFHLPFLPRGTWTSLKACSSRRNLIPLRASHGA